MTDKRKAVISRADLLYKAIDVSMRGSCNAITRNCMKHFSGLDEGQQQVLEKYLAAELKKWTVETQNNIVTLMRELLEKMDMKESLQKLDEVTRAIVEGHVADPISTPEQFLVSATQSAKANEIKRLEELVKQLETEHADLRTKLTQKKEKNLEMKQQALDKLKKSEEVIMTTREWSAMPNKEWLESLIK